MDVDFGVGVVSSTYVLVCDGRGVVTFDEVFPDSAYVAVASAYKKWLSSEDWKEHLDAFKAG